MNTTDIIKKIQDKPIVKDYTYATLFFLISSFFALYVIKPALTIAFSLEREAMDLKETNSVYEKSLLGIIETQSKLEFLRNRIFVVNDALPEGVPRVRDFLSEMQRTAQEEGITVRAMALSGYEVTKQDDKLHKITLGMDIVSDFNTTQKLISNISRHRRVKTINNLKITKINSEVENAVGTTLHIQMDIESYFL